jgi:hypothetical protein
VIMGWLDLFCLILILSILHIRINLWDENCGINFEIKLDKLDITLLKA